MWTCRSTQSNRSIQTWKYAKVGQTFRDQQSSHFTKPQKILTKYWKVFASLRKSSAPFTVLQKNQKLKNILLRSAFKKGIGKQKHFLFLKHLLIAKNYKRCYLNTTIHQAFVIKLAECPPYTLHKPRIQRFVIILKINPSAHTFYRSLEEKNKEIWKTTVHAQMLKKELLYTKTKQTKHNKKSQLKQQKIKIIHLPFRRISHNNLPTFCVVFVDTHLVDILRSFDP